MQKSSIEEVIAKFAQLTPQERAKRKLESLEALKKTFKKLDHDVNVQEFLGTSTQTVEDLTNQASTLEAQISEIHKRLSYWTNPDKINSVEHLGQMENSLRESLNQIRTHKERLQKQQLMSLECSSQFQHGMHVPFSMGSDQQLQHLPWIPNDDGHYIIVPEDPNLLPHRDVEWCSTASSLGSYSGYFCTSKNAEIHNSGQETSMLNEFSRIAPMRLQLGVQYPYLPYNLNQMNDAKFQPATQLNPQELPVDYHVSGSFDAPRPGYETQRCWASTSGPGPISMFDEHLYNQQPN